MHMQQGHAHARSEQGFAGAAKHPAAGSIDLYETGIHHPSIILRSPRRATCRHQCSKIVEVVNTREHDYR